MKIIGINGSPHRAGNNAYLLDNCLKGAESKGAETESIFLKDYNLRFCEGCFKCTERGRCTLDDDFEMLKEKIYGANGIVFASPSYGIKPTSRMKNFITDRLGLFTVYTSALRGKYLAGISTDGAMGAKQVSRDMVNDFATGPFGRAYVTGTLSLSTSRNYRIVPVDQQNDSMNKARSLGEKMADDIQKGRRYPFQNLIGNFFNRVILRKVFIKNILSNREGLMKAVYDDLKKRGDI